MIIGGILGGLISIPFGRTTNNHFRMFNLFQKMNWFLRLDVEIRHKERLQSNEPYILIANHQSCIDVLAMSYAWPENCVVILKSSLKWLPGFNLCAWLCHSIYINRFNKEKSKNTVDATSVAIKEHKRKVWVFPEGTRNPGSKLLSFKKGAFILAHQSKIPVVCCVFSSHKQFYDWEEKRFDDSGRILAEILPAIDSTKFESIDALSDHCHEIMQKKFDEINQNLGITVESSKRE
ncbi:unnamed protein product, partial [Mesorhabditis belari]|uniref:1-acyl-sn-glycerol-3-phosphate acyltransferase n=1 Tax=Mesorhabditis belari TaxID=2138241 RepID=A0AAF3F860_9BILA